MINGGDLVSTWVAKLAVHVEDVTYLVKYVTNHIVANRKRNFVNDAMFDDVELAEAA